MTTALFLLYEQPDLRTGASLLWEQKEVRCVIHEGHAVSSRMKPEKPALGRTIFHPYQVISDYGFSKELDLWKSVVNTPNTERP